MILWSLPASLAGLPAVGAYSEELQPVLLDEIAALLLNRRHECVHVFILTAEEFRQTAFLTDHQMLVPAEGADETVTS